MCLLSLLTEVCCAAKVKTVLGAETVAHVVPKWGGLGFRVQGLEQVEGQGGLRKYKKPLRGLLECHVLSPIGLPSSSFEIRMCNLLSFLFPNREG